MPVHKMNLIVGAIITLLRNLNTNRSLGNGKRLVVKSLRENLITAGVLTGTVERQKVLYQE